MFELKDRITPQVNFFQYWASKVVAGTGEGRKDKGGGERLCVTKQESMWKDIMHVRMYVCT